MKLLGRPLVLATGIGTVLQLAMVTIGHSNPAVKEIFAIGGMGLSAVAGILYTVLSEESKVADVLAGGAIAGGVCALIGIAVSCALGDVMAAVLLFGTASSAVTGAVGGWIGRLFASGRI